MLILLGSKALNYHLPGRSPKDHDILGTYPEVNAFINTLENLETCYPTKQGNKLVIKTKEQIIEAEIAWENSHSEKLKSLIETDENTQLKNGYLIPSLNVLYLLKMSHRFLKNSPHFLKTMEDIHYMRENGAYIPKEHETFFKEREKKTYTYKHPRLNVKKQDFFNNDGVNYIYDHDSIHEVMKQQDKPAYTHFKPEQEDVLCSKEMFDQLPHQIKLNAVLEETYVLALERSQIPFRDKVNPKTSFETSLNKVCSSITSGWFREFAWEHYKEVTQLYNENYVDKFWLAVEQGKVAIHKAENNSKNVIISFHNV